jgi:hypothetical protein
MAFNAGQNGFARYALPAPAILPIAVPVEQHAIK